MTFFSLRKASKLAQLPGFVKVSVGQPYLSCAKSVRPK